jgi:hypothetical protein
MKQKYEIDFPRNVNATAGHLADPAAESPSCNQGTVESTDLSEKTPQQELRSKGFSLGEQRMRKAVTILVPKGKSSELIAEQINASSIAKLAVPAKNTRIVCFDPALFNQVAKQPQLRVAPIADNGPFNPLEVLKKLEGCEFWSREDVFVLWEGRCRENKNLIEREFPLSKTAKGCYPNRREVILNYNVCSLAFLFMASTCFCFFSNDRTRSP